MEAAQLLRVADIATASLIFVVEADERRSLLSVELGRGLVACEEVIVFTAGLMLTFLDSRFCFAGEEEDEEGEGALPLALVGVAAAPGRAAAVVEEPEAPTALRLEVDERPGKDKTRRPLVIPFGSLSMHKNLVAFFIPTLRMFQGDPLSFDITCHVRIYLKSCARNDKRLKFSSIRVDARWNGISICRLEKRRFFTKGQILYLRTQ